MAGRRAPATSTLGTMHNGLGDRSKLAAMLCQPRGSSNGYRLCAALVAAIAVVLSMGCMRDPLDPRGNLARRLVSALEPAERQAQGREAYGRAQMRSERVRPGMSVTAVEKVMGAFIAVEARGEVDDEFRLPRRKLIEGFLCSVMPSALRNRWLFGYDEGGVEFVGFALEFERDDPEKGKWTLQRVDRKPNDDCEE